MRIRNNAFGSFDPVTKRLSPPSSPVAQMVKNLPAMQETLLQSLGQEYLQEKQMATHSSIPAWGIPWTKKLGKLQAMGSQKSWTQFND